MKLNEDQVIKTIVTRLKGIIDEKKAKRIYEMSNITVDNGNNIKINGKTSFVLDKLLRNLLKEGDYLVKITLHNIAQENELNICPLCQEVNEAEKADKEKTCDKKDDTDKDLTVNMLHSTSSKKIILISLRNGASLSDHAADCPILVLCVSGRGTFEFDGKTRCIKEGDLINLDARVIHNVKAQNELEILITKFLAE